MCVIVGQRNKQKPTSASAIHSDDASLFEDEDEDESDYGLLSVEHDEVFQVINLETHLHARSDMDPILGCFRRMPTSCAVEQWVTLLKSILVIRIVYVHF